MDLNRLILWLLVISWSFLAQQGWLAFISKQHLRWLVAGSWQIVIEVIVLEPAVFTKSSLSKDITLLLDFLLLQRLRASTDSFAHNNTAWFIPDCRGLHFFRRISDCSLIQTVLQLSIQLTYVMNVLLYKISFTELWTWLC